MFISEMYMLGNESKLLQSRESGKGGWSVTDQKTKMVLGQSREITYNQGFRILLIIIAAVRCKAD